MNIKLFIALGCVFFAAGCAATMGTAKKSAAAASVQNEAKVWTFALQEGSQFKLPKGFVEVQTVDHCKLFVYEPKVFSDVDITVKIKATSGKKDFGGGILFRYNDPQNYYCVRYNAGVNNFRFYKSIKGDRARFANRTVRLKDKAGWHELRLVSRGDMLEAYIDGRLYLRREDEILKQGKVGLWVRGEEPKTQFSDLVIRQ